MLLRQPRVIKELLMFQKLKRNLIVAATGIFVTASLTAGAFAASATATTHVNMRAGAGNSYRVVSVVAKGQTVTTNGKSGNWTKVTAGGKTGYVHSKYLTSGSASTGTTTSTSTTTNTASTTVYATSAVNVRSGPSTSYKVITSMSKGQIATKTGVSGNWAKISVNGKTGYVSSKYLTTSKPSTSQPTTSQPSNSGNKKLVGNFKLTFYAGDSTTASGRTPRVNHTIAADTSVLPMYTKVYIEGWGTYTVEDRGGAIKGKRIDIFVANNSIARKNGVKYANVYIVK